MEAKLPESKHDELALRKEWMEEARKQTLETLPDFLKKLSEFPHDHGTICRAVAAAAVGAAWAMEQSPSGGITGFQAGCIMWDMITGWMKEYEDKPIRLVSYEKMLYPQYEGQFEKTITPDTWEFLQKRANELLQVTGDCSASVYAHWEKVAAGEVPFGYEVRDN